MAKNGVFFGVVGLDKNRVPLVQGAKTSFGSRIFIFRYQIWVFLPVQRELIKIESLLPQGRNTSFSGLDKNRVPLTKAEIPVFFLTKLVIFCLCRRGTRFLIKIESLATQSDKSLKTAFLVEGLDFQRELIKIESLLLQGGNSILRDSIFIKNRVPGHLEGQISENRLLVEGLDKNRVPLYYQKHQY